MKQNFKIIASLARMNTTKQIKNINKNSLYNVIASIVQYPSEINIDSLLKNSNYLRQHTTFFNKTWFTIIEFVLWDVNDGKGSVMTEVVNTYYLKYFKINIFSFIRAISEKKNLDEVRSMLYNSLSNFINEDSVDSSPIEVGFTDELLLKDNERNNNTIFIFNDIEWVNILILFRLLDISIYGGENTKRHLLSTVQFSLSKFLLLLDVDTDFIYKSFKDSSKSNVKFNKRVINEKFNVNLSKFKQDETYEYIYYYNILMKFTLNILDLNKNKIQILKDLEDVKSKIDLEQKKIKKYSDLFNTKKIDKAKINLVILNKNLTSLINNLQKINISIKLDILDLYKIDKNLFDKNGVFLLTNKIKINVNNNSELKPEDVFIDN